MTRFSHEKAPLWDTQPKHLLTNIVAISPVFFPFAQRGRHATTHAKFPSFTNALTHFDKAHDAAHHYSISGRDCWAVKRLNPSGANESYRA
jgi:hypothetical protein